MGDRQAAFLEIIRLATDMLAGAGWRSQVVIPFDPTQDDPLACFLARSYAAGKLVKDDETLRLAKTARTDWPLDAMTVRLLFAWLAAERGRAKARDGADFGAFAATLDAYEAKLPAAADNELHSLRKELFSLCRTLPVSADCWCESCAAPGGSGKTLSVIRRMLNVAQQRGMTRIIVVVPYVALNNQSYRIYADVFGNAASQHHHAAPEPDETWDAPIVVTTGASFFAALTNTSKAGLRRLANLQGACVFLDDCHAHCESHLWGFYLRLLHAMTRNRFAHVVFGSASFPKHWRIHPDSIPEPKEILTRELFSQFSDRKGKLVQRTKLSKALNVETLVERAVAAEGPTLVVLNTKLTAAIVAQRLRAKHGCTHDIRHISNGIVPAGRDAAMTEILSRLPHPELRKNLILVATSLVETGIDFSFRRGLREAAGYNSSVQVASRINRGGEYGTENPALMEEFSMNDPLATDNPSVSIQRDAADRAERFAAGAGMDVCTMAAKIALEESAKESIALRNILEDERLFRFDAVEKANNPISFRAEMVVRVGGKGAFNMDADAGMCISMTASQLRRLEQAFGLKEIEGTGIGFSRAFVLDEMHYDPFLGAYGFLNALPTKTA